MREKGEKKLENWRVT